jgi:hypothetical protein
MNFVFSKNIKTLEIVEKKELKDENSSFDEIEIVAE